MNSFGENLKKLRRNENYTQDEFSKLLDVGKTTVSMWERGVNYPEVSKLLEIASTFSVSLDELFGIEKTETFQSDLSYAEKRIIGLYRRMDDKHKENAEAVMELFAKNNDRI